MPEREPPAPSVPQSRSVPRKRTRLSLVWFIPILAAVVGAWVAVTRVLSEGPKITIVMKSAEGLEAGKTKIHYNGVDIGTISTIELSKDHQHVILTAQMAPKTEDFLGAYIGVEIGSSREERTEFVALETPPVISGEAPGRFFTLNTSDLGSLDNGTPIYFRRLQVGQVASYALDKDGKDLTVKVFVQAPYDQYVNPNTRFWHASGVDVSLSASGLTVQTQSVLSILIGGIAFETAATDAILPAAEVNTVFTLFKDRAEAFNPPPRSPQTYQLVFKDSVRGLVPGAPVEFRGIPVGEVAAIRAQVDLKTFEFSVPVTIHLDPQRLGVRIVDAKSGVDLETMRRRLIDSLVSHGVRAQLKTGNLLTGSAFVSLDFFPGAPQATVDWSQQPVQLPTIPGQLEEIETSVENIIKKVNQMPLKEIGDDLRKAIGDLDLTLVSARGTLVSAQGTLDNTSSLTGPNSVQIEKLDSTLQEVSRAARSVRVLADYLERHPEALLQGKKGGAK